MEYGQKIEILFIDGRTTVSVISFCTMTDMATTLITHVEWESILKLMPLDQVKSICFLLNIIYISIS